MINKIVCPNLLDAPDDFRCDFELLIEEVTTTLGTALSFLDEKGEDVKTELQQQLNTFFRLTGALRRPVINEEMINTLSKKCETLQKYRPTTTFVLPQGHKASCLLHTARVQTKKAMRLLVRTQDTNLQYANLLNYLSISATYFFLMSLKINSDYAIAEMPLQ